jgi:hypothetical protein
MTALFTAACNNAEEAETTTVPTETAVTVTDENGQPVRDDKGSILTSIITTTTTTVSTFDYPSQVAELESQIESLREVTIREVDPLKKDDFLNAKGNEHISAAVSVRSEIEPYKPATAFIGGKEYSTDIVSLTITGERLTNEDIKELKYFVNLTELHLYSNDISDLSSMQGLTSLTTLSLFDNNISDLSPIAGLYNLENLYLRSNDISDLSPLSGLANLTNLDISDNQVTDLAPLNTCRAMDMLWINDNYIASLEPIYTMTGLVRIHMQNNNIGDLSPLKTMTGMLEIYADNNHIDSITPLSDMTKMQWLRLSNNPVTDGAVIIRFSGLKKAYLDGTLIPTEQINEIKSALPEADIAY